jgi:signal transduction histidine kinase
VPPSRGTLYFGVDARHIRQLGQELVGDRTTALTEMIKNAYDADATEVVLSFSKATRRPGGTLEVIDDGSGMTLDDLKRGWMRISTSIKDEQPISPRFRRARAGRKGIGRFATETLGRRLRLETTVDGDPRRLVVDFDWEHDYPSGSDLQRIGNRYRYIKAPAAEHGTRLRIEGLSDSWDEAARQRVNRAVRLLRPPFPTAPVVGSRSEVDPGFELRVEIDGTPQGEQFEAYDEFLAAATARLEIRASRRIELLVTSQRFEVDEVIPLRGSARQTGAFTVKLAYFVYNRASIGGISVKAAREMSRLYGGIRLYRDGLRVMPYGEPNDDWLGLDELQGSRSSTLVPVRNFNWFGQVLITRARNPQLIDTASREGLVNNAAFWRLREILRDSLIRGAERVGHARQVKTRTSDKPTLRSRATVVAQARDEIVAALRKELSPAAADKVGQLVTRALDLADSEAAAADRDEQAYVASLIGEIDLLRILASLGTSIAVFSHEVRGVLNNASAALLALERDVSELGKVPVAVRRRLADARASTERLQDLSTYIDAYVSVSRRRERAPQPLYRVLKEFSDRLTATLARNVKIEWQVEPQNLRTEPMTRSELETTLINFLTNSVKAMDAEGHDERRIHVGARAEDGEVVLRFQDTGTGVDNSIRDQIFDAFISDSRSSVSELGVGTGLGLKIVADIADAYGGSVALATPSEGFNTCLELRLPRWSEQTS